MVTWKKYNKPYRLKQNNNRYFSRQINIYIL